MADHPAQLKSGVETIFTQITKESQVTHWIKQVEKLKYYFLVKHTRIIYNYFYNSSQNHYLQCI